MVDETEESDEPEETEETEETGKNVDGNKYQDSGAGEEPTPEDELDEDEPKSEGVSKTTSDMFTEYLASDLPAGTKKEFKDQYEPIAKPLSEVIGVEQGYPKFVEKMERLPWIVRMPLATLLLAGSGIFIKSGYTGRGFKEELKETMSFGGNKKKKRKKSKQDKNWKTDGVE